MDAMTETTDVVPERAPGDDPELAKMVRRNTVVRRGFYATVLVIAATGQFTGGTTDLHLPLLLVVGAIAVLELGGVAVLNNAEVRRLKGEAAIGYRVLSAAIAAAAVAFNWLAHDDHLAGGFFAGSSALGYIVWVMHVEDQYRDRQRDKGHAKGLVAKYTAWERISMPRVTGRATLIAQQAIERGQTLGRQAALAAARAELAKARRIGVIASVTSGWLGKLGPLAKELVPADAYAERVAAGIDWESAADLAAADFNAKIRAAITGEPAPGRRDRRSLATAPREPSAPIAPRLPAPQEIGLALPAPRPSGAAPRSPRAASPARAPEEPLPGADDPNSPIHAPWWQEYWEEQRAAKTCSGSDPRAVLDVGVVHRWWIDGYVPSIPEVKAVICPGAKGWGRGGRVRTHISELVVRKFAADMPATL